ncbi:alcohol dehydrogenase [Aspergillus pseudoustus]|uniref:Alcohol dehydrogenase n=1 Tax=Aspergillus pseudoustus TaxID=1810923 RepID=A0ABR4JVK5_9EURO
MEIVRPAFADHATPIISYGVPFPEAAARHAVNTFQARRVYLICSRSLAQKTSMMDELSLVFRTASVAVVRRRIGMKPHTLWSEVLEIVAEARASETDLFLTVGGGTLTDGAKAVVLALANNARTFDDLSTLFQSHNDESNRALSSTSSHIPIISVPTTLSAAEYSSIAGATNDLTHYKHVFPSPSPSLVILDPQLAASTTPARIWLSTGIRALDHCVETFCAVKGTTEASDSLALTALANLVPGLLRCARDADGADLDARLSCQLGSVDAMAACSSEGVQMGASHGIGHQLGPLGVGHGDTSCILLPAVCKYNSLHGANIGKQGRLRDFLLGQPSVEDALRSRGVSTRDADFGDILDALIQELGMPRSLSEVGVSRDQLDEVAANSLRDPWCATNPVPLVDKAQVLEILEMVI